MTARSTVTGRYAGPVSRGLGAAADIGFVVGSYTLGVALVAFLSQVLIHADLDDVTGLPATLLLLGWGALYLMVAIAIAGRTVGQALVGLKVVDREGDFLHGRQAVLWVLMLPVSTVFGIGLVLILLRRDHRALHDLVARTAVVYDWGDRPAELPAPLSAYLGQRREVDTEHIG
ncbi:RDD family protein [Nocardioides sambongensis]|uniref:RDD family protein n=1 Tax=Nocardioides sambongensis TaxID=2589074 RepID=UPI0015E843EB|nr:RDD family protein [Nocardioides sambongensis]